MFGRSAHLPYRRFFLGQGLAGGFLLALFGVSLALASSPALHKLAHADADQADHACAATLILSGGNDLPLGAAVPLLLPAAIEPAPQLSPVLVPPLFLTAYLHEHSPPTAS